MRSASTSLLRLLAFSVVFSGCGGDPVAGGGATETGNGLTCRILTDSGKGAARAKVVFVRTDTWLGDVERDGSPQTFGAQADSAGFVRLARLPVGRWAIQADRVGMQGWKQLADGDSVVDTLKLSRRTLVQGMVGGDPVDRIWMIGTAWSSSVGDGGRYVLEKAAGSYSLVGSSRAPLVALASGVSGVGDSKTVDLVARRRAVVLDDFQDGGKNTTLHAFTGIGNWYLAKDALSRVYSAYDSTGPDYRGALSMQYILKDSTSFVVAGVSFVDADGYHELDLSALDSFCFEARGNGNIEVHFQEILKSDKVERSVSVLVGGLDTLWRRRCLKPSEFGNGWDSLRTNTTDISFSPSGGNRMELRQIEFWGPPLLDLSIH